MQRRMCSRGVTIGAAAVFALGANPPSDVVPLDQVERGLQGQGWSVFSGREPEPFDVEVLGVWQEISPSSSYILARLAGRGLEESGVIAGMSGSPVYVGDRLLGAVAFSWPFAKEPIAGVTPIESMRRMSEGGALPPVRPTASVTAEQIVQPVSGVESLRDQLELLGGRVENRGGLLWSSVGLGGRAGELLAEALGPTAAAGRMESAEEGSLEAGDAVAAVLVDGDLRLAATGTVTDRIGDTVLAFGHPFLGLGDIAVPMAEAEIVTVVPSLASSFKIANLGRIVGSFDRDRPSGIRGRIGLETAMLPLRVTVRGGAAERFEMRLAPIPALTGSLAAAATLGAIDQATGAGGDRSIDLSARLGLTDREPLEIGQNFDGPSASLDAVVHLLNVIGFIMNNGMAELEIEAIDVEIDLVAERRAVRIIGAHASRQVVKPGSRVELRVEMQPWRGDGYRETIELEIPSDLDDGRYILLIGDGTSIDAARLKLEKFAPRRIEQALDFLDNLKGRSQLAVLGVDTKPGYAVGGEALTRLPGSIRGIWRAAPQGAARALATAIRQEVVVEKGVPLEGLVRVDIEVKR